MGAPLRDSPHDEVANLPDHVLLMARLRQVVEGTGGPQTDVAVICLNIDRFRVINHRYGLEGGDRLLVDISGAIGRCLRQHDTPHRARDIVARIGADEFTIALNGVGRPEDARVVIDRIRDSLARQLRLFDDDLSMTACFGVVLGGRGGAEPEQLLQRASIALTRAKERGPDSCHFFEIGVDSSEEQRLLLEHDLREAAGRGQLELHWQPIVSLTEGTISRFEALLRWEHPEHGPVSPMDFMFVAEASGLILPIGRWVLWEACRQVRLWEDEAGTRPRISVNVSERELLHPNYHESVQGVLLETDMDPGGLELEISEGLLTGPAANLRRLKSLGVGLSIDDFGTGSLSITHLARLPVTTLKIDGSVVSRLGEDAEAAAIVRGTLAAARTYELETIAEGIESEDQLEILRVLGCEYGQGFLFTRPVVAEEAQRMLKGNAKFVY